jgi:hypothetical protein
LEGVFTMTSFAKLIIFAFLTILAISETVFIFGTPNCTEAQLTVPASFFPPAMALGLFIYVFIGKWIFGSDVRWISDEIEKSLGDPKSAPIGG